MMATGRRGPLTTRGLGAAAMRDADVRTQLLKSLREQCPNNPPTRIIQELGVSQGSARIDLAVVNGRLDGFEIKSERDTLERLPEQVRLYSKVFDRLTLVVGRSHLNAAVAIIPEWWGIVAADPASDGPDLIEVRPGTQNPELDPLALVELLWRDEALAVLEQMGVAQGLRSKPRAVIWRRLASLLPLDDLRSLVRERLTSRAVWRADAAQTSGGG
jgi:hypothetical protein